MPLTLPTLDDRSYQDLARRGARAHPGPQPGVDELQRQRPRRHADRALRLPDREPALPRQPDPGAQPAEVPAAARRAAAARVVGARARHASPTSAGRPQTIDARPRPRGARRARCRSAPSAGSTCCRSRRASSKRPVANPTQQLATTTSSSTPRTADEPPPALSLQLYETVPLDRAAAPAVALATPIDSSLWIALLLRDGATRTGIEQARRATRGRRSRAAR